MPKKTKKEKIIAGYRRKLKLIQNQNEDKNKPVNHKKTDIKIASSAKHVAATNIQPENTISTVYFSKDLKKSIILIISIIALEFFLYFATIKQYLRF